MLVIVENEYDQPQRALQNIYLSHTTWVLKQQDNIRSRQTTRAVKATMPHSHA